MIKEYGKVSTIKAEQFDVSKQMIDKYRIDCNVEYYADESGLYVIMADNQEYYFEWELLDNVLFVPNVVEKHV